METAEKFRRYIAENRLIDEGDKIICGLSGGVDSMVMTSLLIDEGFDVVAAHCNFSLRGEESDGDEALVRNFCISRQIPLHTITFNTQEYSTEKGISIQMAARELRYDWFEELSKQFGCKKVAIAHNSNDDIEGFFINLVRGSGIRGLNGMKNHTGKIIRPLMSLSREEIERYSTEKGIAYRTDSSNLKTKYLRNKIRIDILPQFREITPQFDKIMGENLTKINEATQMLDIFLQQISCKALKKETNWEVDLSQIANYPKCDFLLYELIREKGFEREECRKMMESYQKSGTQFKSKSFRGLINREKLIIEPITKEEFSPIFINEVQDIENLLNMEIEEKEKSKFCTNRDNNIAFMALEKVKFPLKLSLWSEGDRFQPLGMKSHKKVSDFLIDQKASLFEKEKQLILKDSNDNIIWLVGRRISDLVRIEGETARILKIKLI